MTDVAVTSFMLDDETRARVQRLAEARKTSSQGLIREAVEQYVEREEARQNWRQEALERWREYEETGLHLTAAEADAWLAKLEAGVVEDPPECHT